MTMAVEISEAENRLHELALLASSGSQIVLIDGGKPVARIVAVERPLGNQRVTGLHPDAMKATKNLAPPLPDALHTHGQVVNRRDCDDTTQQEAVSTTFRLFDAEEAVGNLMGNLPHWRQQSVIYFATFRCADSMPRAKLARWHAEHCDWLKSHPEPHTPEDKAEYWERFPKRFHEWLDAGHGECLLARPDVGRLVESAMLHFAGERYTLDEFVVMPNHVHALVAPLKGHSLSEILHSWKSFTANEINRKLGRRGSFWQKESFDHIVRTLAQLEWIRWYIQGNPY